MERIEKPHENLDSMNIKFTPRIQSGEDVLTVRDVKKTFNGREIFKNISFNQYRRDRSAIIGENGVGKTTLFRIILNEIKPDQGYVKLGSSVNIGYFDQEQKSLNTENTIIDEIWEEYPMMTNFQVRSYLAKFMFYQDDVERTISELSGGERARISLLKLMLSDCNFILMDEPTNHLDIDSKEVLEDALLDYEGSVLIISHDRYFLNKVSSKILEMKKDSIEEYLGNYDYYEEKQKELNAKDEQIKTVTETQIKKERRKQKSYQKEKTKLRKKIQELEKESSRLEEEINQLTNLTLEEDFYQNEEIVKETFDKIKDKQSQKQAISDTWLELSIKLDEY